jgi:AraC-like DNA-binding protein
MSARGDRVTGASDGRAVLNLRMPAVYVQHLARELADERRLYAGTGISRSDLRGPNAQISVADNLRCVANATRIARHGAWYQEWATRIAEHFHGPLTAAWLSAPTLGDGLDLFVRHFPARIPYMHIRSHARGDRFVIEMRPLTDVGSLLPLLVEVPMLILQQYIGTIRSSRGPEAVTELAYEAPAYRRAYARWFESEVRFAASRNALDIPAAWRGMPNLSFEESAWRAALRRCEDGNDPQSPRSIVNRLRAAFCDAFDQDGAGTTLPTLDGMAAALGMSPRTLIRRLRSLGTTFHDERDELRRIRAREMVEAGELSVTGIAEVLRFSDPPNFGKAFKRWFGVSPGEYRARRARASATPPLSADRNPRSRPPWLPPIGRGSPGSRPGS